MEDRRMDTENERRGLELYVRSLSPAGARTRQEAVIERLAALAEREVIAGYDVHVWGTGIRSASPAARTASGRFILERLAAFDEWAARNEATLGTFETNEVASTLTGTTYTERSVPILALAVFENATLRHVAPCRENGEACSVEDCLDAIEAGEPLADTGEPTPVPVGSNDGGRDGREPTAIDADEGADGTSDPNTLAVSEPIGE